jgi:hypothetical protein
MNDANAIDNHDKIYNIFERQIKRCRETRIFVDNIGFRV